MKSKISITLIRIKSLVAPDTYSVRTINGAVTVRVEAPGKPSITVRAGDEITEETAELLNTGNRVTTASEKRE